jgi:thiol-disulfide isomerase/thioredoxin
LPSGNLYKLAKQELEEINAVANAGTNTANAAAPVESLEASALPEIIGSQWIGLRPTKLTDLKGKVVLLDFWAPWCGPCLFTFPSLQRWHAAYKDKGLVILGVTRFYGEAEGRRLSRAEEVAYLSDFKKRNLLHYGFVVTESAANELNYGAFTLPMSFLIDRRGNLRYISPGANPTEGLVLGKMIKKLIDEPAGDLTSPVVVGAAAGAQTDPKPQ